MRDGLSQKTISRYCHFKRPDKGGKERRREEIFTADGYISR
jgi:hypothetical protein